MNQHYFTSQPPTDHVRNMDVVIRGIDHNVITAPGLFSADRLDKATQVLIDKFSPDVSDVRVVADVGCGWGPLSLMAADEYPHAEIWASDVNPRALDVTRRNLHQMGHTRVHVGQDDQLRAHAAKHGVLFDVIVSNPPVRVGKKVLHSLLLGWLELLAPDGEMWLVVGKNLGADSLATWLMEHGFDVTKIASKKGFRVLRVMR